MRLGAKIFGGLAAILLLYLGIGFFLPGTWHARAERTVQAMPEEVFPFLNSPSLWVRWNAMPESGSSFLGPEEGVGSGLEWDDPRYGSGSFQVKLSRPNRQVGYEVQIESGTLVIIGTVRLEPEGQGSRIVWEESGDFGRNPLLGYSARGMGRSQAQAMEASLDSLVVLLEEEGRPPSLP